MTTTYLFDQLSNLKQKFTNFFTQRKKVKALENYATTGDFKHRPYLNLIRECMQDGFLEERESTFLDHMLAKYELKFLDWCHRTKWLKKQISEAKLYKKHSDQLLFDFEKLERINIPAQDPALAFLAAKSSVSRRASR